MVPAVADARTCPPTGRPTAGRAACPTRRRRGPRLDPDRHRGRLPAGSRRSCRSQPITWNHEPDHLQLRQRRPALAAARPGRACRRHRRLLAVRRQDADPLQRRSGGLPGARPALRLLHRQPRPHATTGGVTGDAWPGYGPNTRTIMQIKVADATAGSRPSTWPRCRPSSPSTARRPGVFAARPGPRSSSARRPTTRRTTRPSRPTWPLWGYARIQDYVHAVQDGRRRRRSTLPT